MSLQDAIAIFGVLTTIITIVYMLGQQSQKIAQSAKDLDALFDNVRLNNERLSDLEKAFIRTEQRVTFLEDRVYGDETIARVRER
ncbi:hypothetical protein H6F44_11875 [Pseudanabaena sp. FACHB-1277]|uniref:Uncharacterized protein n=1 Tax=Pseudanabaena cinerea FACHB-1277 TaxID=2949581 RepID=A0A926Z6J3_9CYAN|nr:hypothetical protein [Pseudanabaena cinerea]MBD2150813.1 hypothetical protein [Pseudanabaena cinerea FACHB-1277]